MIESVKQQIVSQTEESVGNNNPVNDTIGWQNVCVTDAEMLYERQW